MGEVELQGGWKSLDCLVLTPVVELPSRFGHASRSSRVWCRGTGPPTALVLVQEVDPEVQSVIPRALELVSHVKVLVHGNSVQIKLGQITKDSSTLGLAGCDGGYKWPAQLYK